MSTSPKICVLMHYDENRSQVGSVAEPLAREYCERHGYAFICRRESFLPNPYFSKIDMARHAIDRSQNWFDYVFWMDADCIIFNPEFKLESLILDFSMAISQDRDGICAGVWLLKNCAWSERLLDCWNFLGPIKLPTGNPNADQNTLKLMMASHGVSSQISLISTEIISNQECVPSKNPFIHHYWSTNKDQAGLRLKILSDISKGKPI